MSQFSWRRILPVLALLGIACAYVMWRYHLLPTARPQRNSIIVIAPYRWEGTWVFDDPNVGLVREPFIAGVPAMIDELVKDIPQAAAGFRLMVSAQEFPGYQKRLRWLRGEAGGNYYELDTPKMEGWICPALFKYYETAPQELFVRAEAKQ